MEHLSAMELLSLRGVKFRAVFGHSMNYNAAANKVVFAGRDDANSYHQKYVTATVSGNIY